MSYAQLITDLQARIKALKAEIQPLISPMNSRGELRALTREENAAWETKTAQIRESQERLDELIESEAREASSAEHNRKFGLTGGLPSAPVGRPASGWSVGAEAGIYRDPWEAGADSPSFFKDLRNARMGDFEAAERLNRNHRSQMERRAGDLSTTAGQGGQFAPPAWLVDEFVKLARPGRVTADLLHREALPSNISSINLPKVASGTTVAVQATQNSALSDTAMTTTSVSSGITTIGGKQIVSLQLLNQSGVPFDRVILQDLAAEYAKQLDAQVLYGSNASGQLNGLVGVAVDTAFTTTQPALVSTTTANSFLNRVIAASAGIATTRFLPATAIVLHPNRWAWCMEALDGNVRPLISADGPVFNTAGISSSNAAEGAVGALAKLPVFTDPNISLTANSATNQDEAYVLRTDDIWLYETQPLMEAFDSTYADQASVLFRVLGWVALISNRYTGSVASIRGTGMITPTL